MDETQLQLEALREIRGWSTWIVGIGGTILAFVIAFMEKTRKEYVGETKTILILGTIAFVCAIGLIISVPSAIEILPINYPDKSTILSFDMSGVFGYAFLSIMPIFYIYIAMFISIVIIIFILLTIFWRNIF